MNWQLTHDDSHLCLIPGSLFVYDFCAFNACPPESGRCTWQNMEAFSFGKIIFSILPASTTPNTKPTLTFTTIRSSTVKHFPRSRLKAKRHTKSYCSPLYPQLCLLSPQACDAPPVTWRPSFQYQEPTA